MKILPNGILGNNPLVDRLQTMLFIREYTAKPLNPLKPTSVLCSRRNSIV